MSDKEFRKIKSISKERQCMVSRVLSYGMLELNAFLPVQVLRTPISESRLRGLTDSPCRFSRCGCYFSEEGVNQGRGRGQSSGYVELSSKGAGRGWPKKEILKATLGG